MKSKATILLMFLTCSVAYSMGGSEPHAQSEHELQPFCAALQNIRPNQVLGVITEGIFVEGFEKSLLYGSGCDGEVQPAAWAEFLPDVKGRDLLTSALRDSGRARIVVRGHLHGPRIQTLSDLRLPTTMGRYGHLNAFRTKIVITDILSASPARFPAVLPALTREEFAVKSEEVPYYPSDARRAELQGEVIVDVTVERGRVTSATTATRSILSSASVDRVKRWQFDETMNETFQTVFVYEIEKVCGRESQERLQLDLPRRVLVVATRQCW